jgi:hypothetical protein
MMHAEELVFCQVTFEDTELNALAKILQGFVNTIPPLIIMDVIGDDHVHVQPSFEQNTPTSKISAHNRLKSHDVI